MEIPSPKCVEPGDVLAKLDAGKVLAKMGRTANRPADRICPCAKRAAIDRRTGLQIKTATHAPNPNAATLLIGLRVRRRADEGRALCQEGGVRRGDRRDQCARRRYARRKTGTETDGGRETAE